MLPLAERLRSARQFQQVFAGGHSFVDGSGGLVVVHILRRPEGQSPTTPGKHEAGDRCCGFSVGKKVGNAVVRNRVKRRLREAYRAHLGNLPRGYWAVVVARSRAATADHAALSRALSAALARAGLLTPPETVGEAAGP